MYTYIRCVPILALLKMVVFGPAGLRVAVERGQ
jgi:hypothetical protein